MPKIKDEIEGKPNTERKRIKALRTVEAVSNKMPLKWKVQKKAKGVGVLAIDDVDIVIMSVHTADDGFVVAQVEATMGDWSYVDDVRIQNMPILVPTGTTHEVVDEYGETVDEPDFEENPEEALRIVIGDVVQFWLDGAS